VSPDDDMEDNLDTDGFWDAGPPEGSELAIIEALLFVSPEPLSVEKLVEITGIDAGRVRELLVELVGSFARREGGLALREVAGGFGFYAVPAAAPFIARLIKAQVNPRLTRAALETLAITAYMQPVPRSVIAEIRGVQSEGVMKTLEDRGLVAAAGKGGPPGYPTLYATTGRFLERFGLKSVEDMPPLERFEPDQGMVDKIERSLSWELMEGDESAGSRETGAHTEDTGAGGHSVPEGFGETASRKEGDQER